MALDDCGCGKNTNQVAQDQVGVQQADPVLCTRTVHEHVQAAAEIIITPDITVTNIQTNCTGVPVILTEFPTNISQECTFTIVQEICAQFDVNFGVTATQGQTGLVCGEPTLGECPPPLTCPETSVAAVPNTTSSYTLNFNGALELVDGTEEWNYELTNNTPFALSHWTFVPCGPITVVDCTAETTGGVPIPVTCIPTNNPQASIDCLPTEFAIEVTPGSDTHLAGETIIYHIVTATTYPIGTIPWGAKAGTLTACGEICGPCPV